MSSIVENPYLERIKLLEGILKNALRDDSFNDHSSGCWQSDAREALGLPEEDEE